MHGATATAAAAPHPALPPRRPPHCTLPSAADKHAIPKVDNTNVDRSVATIHTTVLGCLRRTARVSGAGWGAECGCGCLPALGPACLHGVRRLAPTPGAPTERESQPCVCFLCAPSSVQGEAILSGASLSCKLLLEEYLRCQSGGWVGAAALFPGLADCLNGRTAPSGALHLSNHPSKPCPEPFPALQPPGAAATCSSCSAASRQRGRRPAPLRQPPQPPPLPPPARPEVRLPPPASLPASSPCPACSHAIDAWVPACEELELISTTSFAPLCRCAAPLSEAPADEQLLRAASASTAATTAAAAAALGRPGGEQQQEGQQLQEPQLQEQHLQQLQQQPREQRQEGHQQQEDEGDNRSFYGSDSQVGRWGGAA